MFKSILVPIDIAQPSSWQFAVPQAIELARASQGDVIVLTVVRDVRAMFEGTYFSYQIEKMTNEARKKVDEIVGDHRSNFNAIRGEVRFGSIGQEILDAAKGSNADLILMASHRSQMRDYVIGPNAAFVAQRAQCSVLVLRRFA